LNYPTFRKYFDSCRVSDKTKLPTLETKNTEDGEPYSVIIKQPLLNVTLNHTLASVDGMILPQAYDADKDEIYKMSVENESAKGVMTAEQLKYIRSMIGTIGAAQLSFSVNNGICVMHLFNSKSSDSFDQTCVVTSDAKTSGFTLTITADSFMLLPLSKYNFILDADGLIQFNEVREDNIEVTVCIATIA